MWWESKFELMLDAVRGLFLTILWWLVRHGPWILVVSYLIYYIDLTQPQNGPVIRYKLCILAIAPIAAYWIDRYLIRVRIDLDMPRDVFSAARMITRAIIFYGVARALVGL